MSEDDFWTRKRKQEQKEEEERQEAEERAKKQLRRMGAGSEVEVNPEVLKKFEEQIKRVPITLNQLDNLYRQYVRGVIKRPPIEERQRLEQVMNFLMNLPKPNAAERYSFSSVWSSYSTHRRRWERLLADMEAGKIKHIAQEAKARERKSKKPSDST